MRHPRLGLRRQGIVGSFSQVGWDAACDMSAVPRWRLSYALQRNFGMGHKRKSLTFNHKTMGQRQYRQQGDAINSFWPEIDRGIALCHRLPFPAS